MADVQKLKAYTGAAVAHRMENVEGGAAISAMRQFYEDTTQGARLNVGNDPIIQTALGNAARSVKAGHGVGAELGGAIGLYSSQYDQEFMTATVGEIMNGYWNTELGYALPQVVQNGLAGNAGQTLEQLMQAAQNGDADAKRDVGAINAFQRSMLLHRGAGINLENTTNALEQVYRPQPNP
ncbi:MAG: hypothetical protein ABH817_02190 [archaeon]